MDNKEIYVSGASPQTYFMLRLITRNVDSISLLTTEKKCAYYSKHGKKILVNDYDAYLSELRKVAVKNTLYVTSGKDIEALIEFEPDFFKRKNVFPNDLYGLSYFTSKTKTYELCDALGLPIIKTWPLSSIMPEFTPPNKVIAKWNVENTKNTLSDFKTRVFTTTKELNTFKATVPTELHHKIIVQEYIESKNGSNISFLALYEHGDCKAGLLAQQLEQYPQGITSFLKEYDGLLAKELINAAKKLVYKTKFNGFCEVEFKLDPTFKNFYVLEVNPRPCGWSSALLGKYSNLEKLLIDPLATPVISTNNLKWVNILRYLRGRLSVSFTSFLRGIVCVPFINCYDIFHANDLKPFFSQFYRKKTHVIKKN